VEHHRYWTWAPPVADILTTTGRRTLYIYLYNILGWSSFSTIRPIIRPVIHPSKFLIPEEEEDDGRGGGKTPVVLQFAKSYKLIFLN
jgi:hypothetical protein